MLKDCCCTRCRGQRVEAACCSTPWREEDADAVVGVLHQLLSQEDEWLSWRKNTNMFEVKDVGKLLDEVVGCGLLADDYQIVDVAENREVVGYPNASVAFKLFKMKTGKRCSQMALPKFWRCT